MSDYKVVAGDTLFKVAQAHGISLDALIAANPQLHGSTNLSVGETLHLPSHGSTPTGHPPTGPGPHHYSGPASNFPDPKNWKSFDVLWNENVPTMKINDSQSEIDDIHKSVQQVARESGVDERVILCTIMQESQGNVRVRTTNNGVRNPGLMQSHNGVEFDPHHPDASILQMIKDGTEGTKDGDGIKQTIAHYHNVYAGLRAYNSGSVNLNNLSDPKGATANYVSDIANRLMGVKPN